jgi:hypothetical protein
MTFFLLHAYLGAKQKNLISIYNKICSHIIFLVRYLYLKVYTEELHVLFVMKNMIRTFFIIRLIQFHC